MSDELNIGDLENEEVYVPDEGDTDHESEAWMQMGRAEADPNNDLRDPWFHSEQGRAWLAERGEG